MCQLPAAASCTQPYMPKLTSVVNYGTFTADTHEPDTGEATRLRHARKSECTITRQKYKQQPENTEHELQNQEVVIEPEVPFTRFTVVLV